MKKKLLVVVMALSCMFSNITVFGADETLESTNVFSFVNELEITSNDTRENLDIDTATEMALKNSTELKTANLSLEVSEKQLESSQNTVDYNTGSNGLQSILSLIKNQTSYKNSEEEKAVTEQKIAYEMEQSFIEILNLERDIEISERNIDIQEKNLNISRAKYNMGLLSKQELNEAESSFEKSKESIETQKTNLKNAFKNLNIIIGESDTSKEYNLLIDVEYNPLEIETSIETYAEARTLESVSVKNAERNLQVTKQSYVVEQVSDTGTTVSLMQAENSVSTSEMSLSDMKENMENQIVNLYNTIKSLETSIENNKKQLSDLNKNLEIAKLKYDMGSISEIELLQAENQVVEMENTIIEQIYQHSQNVKQFENVNLL